MKSRVFALTGVATLSVAMVSGVGSADAASKWKTRDTDNISRSVSSGRAYTAPGYFKWQTAGSVWADWRGIWSTTLHVSGPKNSCARLRIITHQYYKTSTNKEYSISKRFPAAGSTKFGYYQYCSASGRGSRSLSGSDIISNHPGVTHKYLSSADISICYAPKISVPATSCYNFTIHEGD